MLNNVILIGRLAGDPKELRTANNNNFCVFTLAVSRYSNKSADFIPCYAWEQVAENVLKYVQKGSLVAVNGDLRSKKNENGYSSLFVNARSVQFLEPKKTTRYVDDYSNEEFKNPLTKEEKKELDSTFEKELESIEKNQKPEPTKPTNKKEENTDKKEEDDNDKITFDAVEIDW